MNHPIPRSPVKSSNVQSVGYDPATQTMDVQFHSGGVYRYSGVPQATHDALMGAKSKGKFMNGISGRFRAVKIQ